MRGVGEDGGGRKDRGWKRGRHRVEDGREASERPAKKPGEGFARGVVELEWRRGRGRGR